MLATTTRKVFPHYFPPTPPTIDNKNPDSDATEYIRKYFLPPGGLEGGVTDHGVYGGYYRDRQSRDLLSAYTPRTSGNYTSGFASTSLSTAQKLNAVDSITDAIDAGFDGFRMDLTIRPFGRVSNHTESPAIARTTSGAASALNGASGGASSESYSNPKSMLRGG